MVTLSKFKRFNLVGVRLARACDAFALCLVASVAAAMPVETRVSAAPGRSSWRVSFDAPSIVATPRGCDVRVDGCEPLLDEGAPALPAYGFSIVLPVGATVEGVAVSGAGGTETIALPSRVRHSLAAVPFSADPATIAPVEADESIYSLDTPWPAYAPARWRADNADDGLRVSVTLFPVQYIPSSDTLLRHASLKVDVSWRAAESADGSVADGAPGRPSRVRTQSAQRLPPRLSASARDGGPSFAMPDSGVVDYAIVSSESLLGATGAGGFAALCSAREASGLSTALVSTEWIYANYQGRDNAERIRNFVIDAHARNCLRYLLLAGSAYSPEIIPVRKMDVTFTSGGKVYSESIPADFYFGCLDGDFDYNGNGIFGETDDGVYGGDIDLVSEVMVGRIPVATAEEVANVVAKILRYEAAASNEVASVAHVGEYLGFGGVMDYAWTSLEQIRLGGLHDGYETLGFDDSRYSAVIDHSFTMYDAAGVASWKKADAIRLFNDGPRLINHLGHGAGYQCMKVTVSANDTTTFPGLTNDVGFVLYSQACETAKIDNTKNCWIEQLLTAPRAGVAAIANSRYGFGTQDSTDGPSHRFHRRFIDALLSDTAITLGEALRISKEAVIHQIPTTGGSVMRWCFYENSLYGDPAMPFAASLRLAAPEIAHVPLQNQPTSAASYEVASSFGPVGLVDMDSPVVVWRVDGGAERTNAMSRIARDALSMAIPAQPAGARVSYRIIARTVSGAVSCSPSADGWNEFAVTEPFSLVVEGAPSRFGEPVPAYGAHAIATGAVVTASAPARVLVSDGVSQACAGFVGTGSVPASGATNSVSFLMSSDSRLQWNWRTEHALALSSRVPTNLCETLWFPAGAAGGTPIPPRSVEWGGDKLVFCGWKLDGVRQPSTLPSRALERLEGVDMSSPHSAEACYLEASLDADGNGFPDWWEILSFGEVGNDPLSDPDGDGAVNSKEFEDGTDPLDPASILYYPVIGVSPAAGLSAAAGYGQTAHESVSVSNTGNAALHWTLASARVCDAEDGAPGWATNAAGQAWQVSSARADSGSRSFHSGLVSNGAVASHASLDAPTVTLGANARLAFSYWIESELDSSNPGKAWDGAVVEVSTDGGETFSQLPGPYTHAISGWDLSPWPDGTPCLAGDGTEGWRRVEFDLSAFAGQSVTVRFVNGGDSNGDLEGIYLDDIAVGPVADPLPAWVSADVSGTVGAGESATCGVAFETRLAPSKSSSCDVCFSSDDPKHPVWFHRWRLARKPGVQFILW